MKDVNPLAGGFGSWMSDALPFMPGGMRRQGAARIMAARMDNPQHRKPSFLIRYPLATELLRTGGTLGMLAAGRPIMGLAAYLTMTALKRQELNEISERYARQKRRRLREIGEMTDVIGMPGTGPSRAGAAQAYASMKAREWKDLPAMSEAGDSLSAMTGGLYYPIAHGIDELSARGFVRKDKQAEALYPVEKQKDISFHDQRRNRTLPYMLLAGLGATGGMYGINKELERVLRGEQGRREEQRDSGVHNMFPDAQRGDLIKHVSGHTPTLLDFEDFPNAFFFRPGKSRTSNNWKWQLPYHDALEDEKVLENITNEGLVGVGSMFNHPAIVAHEAGHAKIEHTPGILQFLQRHVYPYDKLLTPLTSAGSLAAGLASKSPLRGALYGLGIGALGGIGTMAPEYMATQHGLKGLKTFDSKGTDMGRDNPKLLNRALATYIGAKLLMPTLAGAAGGWIGSRRAKEKAKQLAHATNIIPFKREEQRKAASALYSLW